MSILFQQNMATPGNTMNNLPRLPACNSIGMISVIGVLTGCLMLSIFATLGHSQVLPPQTPPPTKAETQDELVTRFLESTKHETDPESETGRIRIGLLQQRGEQNFIRGAIKQSLLDFDAVIKLDPRQDPYHWQRGISYYYDEDYEAGKAQFERHQTVNTQDVENAVWHFLCAVRTKDGNVESARKNLIPIEHDIRVPMKQIHSLFAGTAKAADVLAVCKSRDDKCYAHLYLGLYYEAIGNTEQAQQHIERSANEFKMDHYMGQVAQVHAQLRGWKSPHTMADKNTMSPNDAGDSNESNGDTNTDNTTEQNTTEQNTTEQNTPIKPAAPK